MMDQLPLDVGLRDDLSFSNYVVGSNAATVAALRQHLSKCNDPIFWLRGESGVGKSHLLAAAHNELEAAGQSAPMLRAGQFDALKPDMLASLSQVGLVIIDDIDQLFTKAAWEQALFGLFNQLRDHGGSMLVSASAGPRQCSVVLPDLKSRLSSGLVYSLTALSDEQRLAALTQRADRRGFELPENTGRYLMHRVPRDLSSLFALLDQLDTASLKAQRRLTIPFVRQALGKQFELKNLED